MCDKEMYSMFDVCVDWRETVSSLFYPCNLSIQLVILGKYKCIKQSTDGNGWEIQ